MDVCSQDLIAIFLLDVLLLVIKQKMMQNFSTHTGLKQSLPTWEGDRSQKFSGGKFHKNHPRDQLDSALISYKPPEIEHMGKKQFAKVGKDEEGSRPHLRTFDIKYNKSKIFEVEQLEKLIKVPFHDRTIQQVPSLNAHLQSIGKSKVKALLNGDKKSGIYRNFYKSQTKSANFVGLHY